jgi:hypothetical protein
MWCASSDEHSRAIDELGGSTMLFHTTESVQAEIAYRQDRIKRDFQRPLWFRRHTAKPERTAPRLHVAPGRHAW